MRRPDTDDPLCAFRSARKASTSRLVRVVAGRCSVMRTLVRLVGFVGLVGVSLTPPGFSFFHVVIPSSHGATPTIPTNSTRRWWVSWGSAGLARFSALRHSKASASLVGLALYQTIAADNATTDATQPLPEPLMRDRRPVPIRRHTHQKLPADRRVESWQWRGKNLDDAGDPKIEVILKIVGVMPQREELPDGRELRVLLPRLLGAVERVGLPQPDQGTADHA